MCVTLCRFLSADEIVERGGGHHQAHVGYSEYGSTTHDGRSRQPPKQDQRREDPTQCDNRQNELSRQVSITDTPTFLAGKHPSSPN